MPPVDCRFQLRFPGRAGAVGGWLWLALALTLVLPCLMRSLGDTGEPKQQAQELSFGR